MFAKNGYKSFPLSFNRRMVAASASVSRQKNVIHSFAEVDVSIPLDFIKTYHEKTNEKLSFTAYIVKCLAETIKDFPDFNSFIKRNKLIVLEDITVNVLIEREIDGEKVPEQIGIHNVQEKNLLQIHREIRETKNQKTNRLGDASGQKWINWIPSFLLKFVIRILDKNIKLASIYDEINNIRWIYNYLKTIFCFSIFNYAQIFFNRTWI